ncbi:MAG: FAD-dependent oxidoreductase [Desulfurococcales archaeon]|nr:FAD-dependent oxidoreductase [Desulfurococcales archaeon]
MNILTIPPNIPPGTIDADITEILGSPIGLNLSLKMKRPRFPFTDRIWSPGNKAYLVREGYTVEPTHYLVETRTDIAMYKSSILTKILSTFHEFIGAGFYHKWLFRRLWPMMWKIIAKSSGLPEFMAYKHGRSSTKPKVSTLSPDVLVVGGGLSGLIVASKASEKGAKIVLVDDHKSLGGFYRHLTIMRDDINKIIHSIQKRDSLILSSSKFLGRFRNGYAIASPGTFYIVKPKSVVYSTGGINPIPLYENNDLPGTIDLEMMFKLSNRKPDLFKKTLILGCPQVLPRIANELGKNKLTIVCDTGTKHFENLETRLQTNHYGRLLKARGKNRIENIVFDDGIKIKISFVVSGYTPFPDINPVMQEGAKPLYLSEFSRFTVQHDGYGLVSENVYVAGLTAGFFDEKCALHQSEIAGLLSAASKRGNIPGESMDILDDECSRSIRAIKNSNGLDYTLTPAHIDFWETKNTKGLQFVDWDIDITIEDIVKTYDKGYNVMELIKRYTGVGTGAEQGRLTIPTTIMVLSALKRIPLSKIGWFRIRPPHMLPTIGELSAEVE